MRYPRSLVLVLAFLTQAFCPVATAAPKAPQNNVVILATTTSTQDSGLPDVLLPEFQKATRYFVKTISVGFGQAIAMSPSNPAACPRNLLPPPP